MYSERSTGRSFYLLLVLAVCLLSCFVHQSYARDMASHEGLMTDTEDFDHPVMSSEDVTSKKPSDILGKFGLSSIVPQLVSALDHADDLFSDVTNQKHFVAVNKVLKAFLDAFSMTLNPAMQAEEKPQGQIDPIVMNDLLQALEHHFKEILRKDPLVSSTRLDPFIHQYADQLTNTLTEAYSQMHQKGFKLSWSVLYMLPSLLRYMPTELLSREMFSEFIEVPGQLKQFVHDTLESILSSDNAHFIQMAIQFVSTLIASHSEKVEL